MDIDVKNPPKDIKMDRTRSNVLYVLILLLGVTTGIASGSWCAGLAAIFGAAFIWILLGGVTEVLAAAFAVILHKTIHYKEK